jgi:hypothetical protein
MRWRDETDQNFRTPASTHQVRAMWCNPHVVRRLVLSALIALSAALPARAQAIATNGRTVLVAVVNPQGRPVVDIGLDDVVVTEGAEPREVLDVHVADYPLALVIDDRASPSIPIGAVLRAAQRFIGRVGERPIALVKLSDGERPVVGLDEDRATLLDRLGAMRTSTAAVTPPLETIARASTLLKDTDAPFSAVVVIAAAPVDATALVRGELLPQILDSGAAVHVVQVQPAADPVQAERGDPDLLRVIADQSKGQFTAIFSSASYDAALDRLADRLAIEMMIQYMVPPGPKAGDVRVGVRLPGLRAIGLGVR